MQYTVPQFIEYEPKIVGPFTFKQFIFVAVAAAITFIFYFTSPIYITILVGVICFSVAFSLAFLKISGRSLPEFIKNFLTFSSSPKIYVWKRVFWPKVIKKEVKKKTKEEIIEETPLKIGGGSRLRKLSTQIETKTK